MNIKTNPTELDMNKDAILISFLAKGNKIRMRTQLVGDIVIEDLEYLEIRMPEDIQRNKYIPEADRDDIKRNGEPMEEDATSSKKQEIPKSKTQK